MDNQWIESLKVGDTVAIEDNSKTTEERFSSTEIIKITPTGRLKLKNGLEFEKTGRLRGKDAWLMSIDIIPLTEEIANTIQRNELVKSVEKKINSMKWENVIDEDLNRILSILRDY